MKYLGNEESYIHSFLSILVETSKARPQLYNLTTPEAGFSYVATVTINWVPCYYENDLTSDKKLMSVSIEVIVRHTPMFPCFVNISLNSRTFQWSWHCSVCQHYARVHNTRHNSVIF